MRILILGTLMLALAPAAALAEAETRPSMPFIEVSARATRAVPVDQVTVSFYFDAEGTEAPAVTQELSEKLVQFAANLNTLGIPEDQIRFVGPEVSIRYRRELDQNDREIYNSRRPDGFTGTARAFIKMTDFTKVNAIATAGIAAGGQLQQPQFNVSKSAQIEQELSLEAVRRATQQARDMIKAAGARPGRILFIGDPQGLGGGGDQADLPAAKPQTTDEIDKPYASDRGNFPMRGRPRGEARCIGWKRRQAAYSSLAGLRRPRALSLGGRGRQVPTKRS